MPGPRVNNDERSLLRVGWNIIRRKDADEAVIHGSRERGPQDHGLICEAQDVRDNLLEMLEILIAAFAHHVRVKPTALPKIHQVLRGRVSRVWSEGMTVCARVRCRHGRSQCDRRAWRKRYVLRVAGTYHPPFAGRGTRRRSRLFALLNFHHRVCHWGLLTWRLICAGQRRCSAGPTRLQWPCLNTAEASLPRELRR